LKITPTPSSRVSRLICLQFCTILHTLLPVSSSPTFIDIGSGWGGVLKLFARQGPPWKYIGYEVMPIATFWSRISTFTYTHIQIKSNRFSESHFLGPHLLGSNPLILFSYLCPEQMQVLSTLFQAHSPRQTLLLTLTFNLPNYIPVLSIPIPYTSQSLEIYIFDWPELESALKSTFPHYVNEYNL
jgi:hypothetical protein